MKVDIHPLYLIGFLIIIRVLGEFFSYGKMLAVSLPVFAVVFFFLSKTAYIVSIFLLVLWVLVFLGAVRIDVFVPMQSMRDLMRYSLLLPLSVLLTVTEMFWIPLEYNIKLDLTVPMRFILHLLLIHVVLCVIVRKIVEPIVVVSREDCRESLKGLFRRSTWGGGEEVSGYAVSFGKSETRYMISRCRLYRMRREEDEHYTFEKCRGFLGYEFIIKLGEEHGEKRLGMGFEDIK